METIREQLEAMKETEYCKFTQNLIPGIDNILGIRVPVLRKMAKELSKQDCSAFLNSEEIYFEETMLKGFVIGYKKHASAPELINDTEWFLPKINNWEVCDTFCAGLKETKKYKEAMLELIDTKLHSDKEYEVRFAVVMLLDYYIEEGNAGKVLERLDGVTHDAYYAKMAVAWAVSVCMVKDTTNTIEWLQHCHLDVFTYNKSIQKSCESYRIDDMIKKRLREMRR